MSTLSANKVFRHLETSKARIVVEQGGTRSGKTYNILMWIISYCLRNTGKTITICRKTYPALRASAMRDFIEIADSMGIPMNGILNKSTSEIRLNGNLIEFIGLDQPQKIRGRKRDMAFANEANELSKEDFFQLNIRTRERFILDYNPSEEFHWIYDEVIPRDDCDFFQTTYKDNPFLSQLEIKEIERLQQTDPFYWMVYGLGERGANPTTIFRANEVKKIPDRATLLGYGLDFGFTNNPSALVAAYIDGDNLYFQELLYQTNLTNQDLNEKFKQLNLVKGVRIVADSAEPKSIEELHRLGWNVFPCDKGTGSINLGIDLMKRYILNVTNDSVNLIKEFRNYKWEQDKNGKALNIPVKMFDHGIDAVRYVIMSRLSKPNFGKYAIR